MACPSPLRHLLALPALLGLTRAGSTQATADRHLAGTWSGVAAIRPDSGLPVSLRLKIGFAGDSLRVALSLPESRLVDLTIPSPYSDSSSARAAGDSLHLEFTPDIGLGFISYLGIPRDSARIALDARLRGDSLIGLVRITCCGTWQG